MRIIRVQRHPVRRALTAVAMVAGVAGGGVALVTPTPGAAQEEASVLSSVALFDARAVGSIVNFSFHVPEAFFPFQITGGMLESTSRATSSPLAFGTAGLMPVPLATSIGLIVPQVIPGTDIPVPEDVQEAFKSIDFTAMPNGCQASFPVVTEGNQEATCGGPDQRDAALGFTAAFLNGHVRASGDLNEPFATRTVSTSRGGDVVVPGLQARFHQAYSESRTGLNEGGLPQGRAVAEIDSMAILGAAVQIEGIRSETVVSTDGTGKGTAARSTFTVRSASVVGIPVTIGPDGVSVNRQAVPGTEIRSLAAQVEKALGGAGGLQIRLVPAPPVEVRGGEVAAQSGAIEVSYRSQDPTPTDVVQRFAYTRAVVNAVPEAPPDSDLVVEAPIGEAPIETDGGAGTASEAASFSPALPEGEEPVLADQFTSPGTAGTQLPAVPEAAVTAVEPGAVPGESSRGPAVSAGRFSGDQSAVALRSTGFSPVARTRLKALYGGVVVVGLLGLALFPLIRRASRQPS